MWSDRSYEVTILGELQKEIKVKERKTAHAMVCMEMCSHGSVPWFTSAAPFLTHFLAYQTPTHPLRPNSSVILETLSGFPSLELLASPLGSTLPPQVCWRIFFLNFYVF